MESGCPRRLETTGLYPSHPLRSSPTDLEMFGWIFPRKRPINSGREKATERETLTPVFSLNILSRIEFQMQYGVLACTFRQTVMITSACSPLPLPAAPGQEPQTVGGLGGVGWKSSMKG